MLAAALAVPLMAGATNPPSADGGPAAATGGIVVTVDGLRSTRGVVKYCLTAVADNFPDCADDAQAIWRTTRAADPVLRLAGLTPGSYALSVIHDENGNDRLDSFAGIPREGFGFSNNPRIGFGPPKFAAARFAVDRAVVEQRVRMKYIL